MMTEGEARLSTAVQQVISDLNSWKKYFVLGVSMSSVSLEDTIAKLESLAVDSKYWLAEGAKRSWIVSKMVEAAAFWKVQTTEMGLGGQGRDRGSVAGDLVIKLQQIIPIIEMPVEQITALGTAPKEPASEIVVTPDPEMTKPKEEKKKLPWLTIAGVAVTGIGLLGLLLSKKKK